MSTEFYYYIARCFLKLSFVDHKMSKKKNLKKLNFTKIIEAVSKSMIIFVLPSEDS